MTISFLFGFGSLLTEPDERLTATVVFAGPPYYVNVSRLTLGSLRQRYSARATARIQQQADHLSRKTKGRTSNKLHLKGNRRIRPISRYMLKFARNFCIMKPPVNAVLLHDVDIPTKKATFGMGCFWSNDSLFGATPGVVRTRVGYAGGTTKNPHYRSIGDHTEVIELDYDPKTVTYEDLLDMFWENHEYGLTTKLKRQYQSMILYHDEEQRDAAEASYKKMQVRCDGQLRTEIMPAGPFYPAEDYHQKYRLQGHKDLCRSLGLDSSKLQTSHLAARLNGYLVGVGGKNQFEEEVARLGLNEKQAEYVRRELERNEGGGLAC